MHRRKITRNVAQGGMHPESDISRKNIPSADRDTKVKIVLIEIHTEDREKFGYPTEKRLLQATRKIHVATESPRRLNV